MEMVPRRVGNAGERATKLPLRALSWTRWEFWPWWATYGPIVPYGLWLALRHGGLTVPLIANTHPDLSMLAGESKSRILALVPERWRVPFEVVPSGDAAGRNAAARQAVARRGWNWPIVAKPDVGERGAGFRVVKDAEGLGRALAAHAGATILQPFHPGPHEIGLLYARHPDRERGEIISATTKEFADVVGDGASSLRELILRHPRRRLQARVFLARLGADATRVPAKGERVPLVIAGNHCQGTMFRDGMYLVTDAVRARIDEIARQVPGLHFGRFDIRYRDEAAFARGDGISILELNGIASEPTHIYDPDVSLRRAYRDIGKTLRVIFEIGAAQRLAGAAQPSVMCAVRHIRASLQGGATSPLAD